MSDRQPRYDAETLERMRRLWEEGELSAAQIAERFGTSKDAVIGQARRRGWKRPAGAGRSQSLPRETSTTLTRLDVIHARMDAMLSETRAAVEDRRPLLVDAERAE